MAFTMFAFREMYDMHTKLEKSGEREIEIRIDGKIGRKFLLCI